MKPIIHKKHVTNKFVTEIISSISTFDCSSYFMNHLGQDQAKQKEIVDSFQKAFTQNLMQKNPQIDWTQEFSPSNEHRDSIDIYGRVNDYNIIIELDKYRADQVAKKFVSRNALFIGKSVVYISLCYPGTSRMNSNECIKYFGYCLELSKKLGNEFIGLIIED